MANSQYRTGLVHISTFVSQKQDSFSMTLRVIINSVFTLKIQVYIALSYESNLTKQTYYHSTRTQRLAQHNHNYGVIYRHAVEVTSHSE